MKGEQSYGGEYNGKELTPELIKKAEACTSVEELLALAKENNISLTAEEAQAYLDELSIKPLDLDDLEEAAGGFCRECYLINDCQENFQKNQCGGKLPCPSEADNPCPNKGWNT